MKDGLLDLAQTHYPFRSPDVTPLDFFLRGITKQRIYSNDVLLDREVLREVQEATNEKNDTHTILKMSNGFFIRAEICVEYGCHNVEI